MTARESTALKELVALLGEGATFSGKLLFEGRLRIDGHFSGEIESDDVLIVGSTAEVEAKINVGSLIVLGGLVRGEVRASKAVELHSPAKVYGNITAPQLMIDRGVLFEGQSRIPPGDPQEGSVGPSATLQGEAEPPKSETDRSEE